MRNTALGDLPGNTLVEASVHHLSFLCSGPNHLSLLIQRRPVIYNRHLNSSNKVGQRSRRVETLPQTERFEMSACRVALLTFQHGVSPIWFAFRSLKTSKQIWRLSSLCAFVSSGGSRRGCRLLLIILLKTKTPPASRTSASALNSQCASLAYECRRVAMSPGGEVEPRRKKNKQTKKTGRGNQRGTVWSRQRQSALPVLD